MASNRSLQERLRTILEQYDDWDDGEGVILAQDVGADIKSYTGTKAWDSGARHEPPPIEPMLRHIFTEVRQIAMLPHISRSIDASALSRHEAAFGRAPTLRHLVAYAALVDPLHRLFDEEAPSEED
jgi:hypothetical protein